MKKLIICVALLIAASASFAQVKQEGNQFSIEQTSSKETKESKEVKTDYTWKDSNGKIYDIYIGSKGGLYIKKVSSKTGKEYRQYLPKEAQEHIKLLMKK